MKCITAGSSGLIGSHLLELLNLDSRVTEIVALTRKDTVFSSPKVKYTIVDFEALPVLENADIAFCSLGSTIKKAGSKNSFFKIDHDYIINFAKACHKAGVPNFIFISSMGADPHSKVFYNQVKGQTEKDLGEIGFKNLILIRPSLLLGERSEFRLGEFLAQKILQAFSPVMLGPLKLIKPIDALIVARKMHSIATECLDNNYGVKVVLNHEC